LLPLIYRPQTLQYAKYTKQLPMPKKMQENVNDDFGQNIKTQEQPNKKANIKILARAWN